MSTLHEKCYSYSPRKPQFTPTYQVLQNHLDTFIHDLQTEGKPLPYYIVKEFEEFLRCGIPSFGVTPHTLGWDISLQGKHYCL